MASKSSSDAAKIAEQLHSASIHLLRRLRREDEESGLSAPRLSALSVLVFGGSQTLGQLAAAEQVRPPTMTRIVDALEQQGLVTREKRAGDGRQIHLASTAAGKKLLLAGRARRVRSLAKQIEMLTPGERATLGGAAAILKGLIQEM